MLRDIRDEDLAIFYEHQRALEACRMAGFPPRDWDAFMRHWRTKVLLDSSVLKKTIVVGNDARRQYSELERWELAPCWVLDRARVLGSRHRHCGAIFLLARGAHPSPGGVRCNSESELDTRTGQVWLSPRGGEPRRFRWYRGVSLRAGFSLRRTHALRRRRQPGGNRRGFFLVIREQSPAVLVAVVKRAIRCTDAQKLERVVRHEALQVRP